MSILFGILVALIGLIAFFYIYLTWNFNYWKKRGVKGSKPKIVYGTLPNSITQKRHMIYDYLDIYNQYKRTESFVGGFLVRTPELMVVTPRMAKEIYVSQFRKFQDNYFSKMFDTTIEPLFGLNPFFLKGKAWKEKRAEITPALTINRVKASYPIMEKVCSRMVNYIKGKNQAEGKQFVFDCKELTQRFTVENVSDCIYGIEAGAFELFKESELLNRATKLMKDLMQGVNIMFLVASVPYLNKIWQQKFLTPDMENFFVTLIRDAVELRKHNNTDRVDFLNYLIQLKEKKGLTDLELQAHTITFFLDGFETSAMVIAHVILCMGRNKDIQNKLRQEIEKHSDENGKISFEQITEIPYLDQCINETLRLFPPAAFSQKECVEEAQLTSANGKVLVVEKGTPVVVPIYCLHNDEDIFPNPRVFNPDRFSPENGGDKKYREMGAFVPFGDGPRTCLGQKFALTQIKVSVCELVRNFEIEVSGKTREDDLFDPKYFLLFLDGGIWCTFKEIRH